MYSSVRHCAMTMPSAMPTTTVSAIPTENGHKVWMSAFSSAPLRISCSAATKIALGGAMKIGSMRRP
jgi:hypothetical protein